jgi:hypothetical protein
LAEICYVCGASAVSVEHAPASCFFPVGHRTNLITVPSCDLHNEKTSKDDEYARNIIAMLIGTNKVGSGHALDKVLRSLIGSVGLQRMTFIDPEPVETPSGKTFGWEIDRARLDRVLRKIGYALYFHVRGEPWSRGLNVLTKDLTSRDGQPDPTAALVMTYEPTVSPEVHAGENPQVFRYFVHGTSPDTTFFRFQFYENFVAYVTPEVGSTSSVL